MGSGKSAEDGLVGKFDFKLGSYKRNYVPAWHRLAASPGGKVEGVVWGSLPASAQCVGHRCPIGREGVKNFPCNGSIV